MDNITNMSKGLHTDNSVLNQPKNTYRFALNTVNETELGDSTFRSNEESNEQCFQLPTGYIPIGDVYINDGETIIFSVKDDETLSEIGIADKDCNYTTIVNADLGFKVNCQIDAVYRLRRGCERVIYWVDPRLRVFNIDKPEDFKDSVGDWDPQRFRLFKTYSDIPLFEEVTIEEGGNLPPGSYNASIQYLDEDLNPTEWITTSETIVIYNDSTSKDYLEIRGSTNNETAYQSFGNTNKSIRFRFGNLDSTYSFYRVAVIEANNGSGQVSNVVLSQEIPTDINTYTYTGNGFSNTTVEEIQAFNNIIEYAEHIEQLENRLIIANTRGKQINFCNLQKYASKIKADLTTKEIILNSISESNPKTGTVYFDGTGYMPGEIYSFGLVWVFEDGTISPTYHIPGKNAATSGSAFTPSSFPMSIDNELNDTFYTDNNSCGTQDYWGVDSEGSTLLGQRVRHHRFPKRNEINKPLLVKDITGSSNSTVNQLSVDIQGTIDAGYTEDTIEYSIEYQIDGNTFISTKSFSTASYDDTVGVQAVITNSTKTITVVNIYENGVITTNPAPSGLSYTTSIGNADVSLGENIYTSEIFGIKFSGIDIPSVEDTNGEKIIGYYIVRNERDQDNKTILDKAILSPLIDEEFYVGHAHMFPNLSDTSRIKTDMFALIHPENSFFKNEYRNANKITREGQFLKSGNSVISDLLIQDTMSGSSYDPDVHKRRENDSDGFDLHMMVRDTEVSYLRTSSQELASGSEIDEIFYLDVLNSKVVDDVNDVKKEVFNLSSDNRIGIVKLDKELDISEIQDKLPYVTLERTLTDPYANFRVTPYYKEINNPQLYLFDGNGDVSFGTEISVFNGDVTVSPLRYTTSSYYDIRIRNRKTKSGLFNFILGVVAIVAGAILSVFTAGASTGLIAVGVSAIGLGISQIATGIKKEQIGKVWGELYEAGLRDTIQDDDTLSKLEYNVPDDEIQWFSDTVTNIWFESTANAALRQGSTINIPDFLNAPSEISTITDSGRIDTPQNEVDSYILDKLTNLDPDNGDGRLYQGFANAEIYEINPDYLRRNREKIFSHLGIEYDCCSDCIETFTHRTYYSEQSFQEELTDNYRVFLPNNYRDIEGNTGDITNLYRLFNNLYIHTEEALWQQPQNYQERVTNDIVSFIGTGSYFNTPPRKIVDDDLSSAGTTEKWGTIKTKNGILFPCEYERKWYLFNGDSLKPISDLGNSNWFKENMFFNANRDFYSQNRRNYPFLNNPSNPYGVGYLSTYDTKKERFIVTKKDFTIADSLIGETDYELCTNGNSINIFRDYQATIDAQEALGFEFKGIENCELKFTRTEYVNEDQTRYVQTVIPNTADIVVHYDTSGSFTPQARTEIKAAVDAWLLDFQANNPDWTGTLYQFETPPNAGEDWINCLEAIFTSTDLPYVGADPSTIDMVVICFTNESSPSYHSGALQNTIPATTTTFDSHVADFKSRYAALNSFKGISYPIVFDNQAQEEDTRVFLQHQLAAFKGTSYTLAEVDALTFNQGFTTAEWDVLKASLQTANPYPDDGLDQYDWLLVQDRYWDGTNDIITPAEFATSINSLLEGSSSTEEQIVTVTVPNVVTNTIASESLTELSQTDTSWTMSFSLKDNSWVGWHSYMPNYYFHIPESFYSWRVGDDNFWRHNKTGEYQTFYGEYFPHIIEYVSLSSPMETRIWDGIKLITEAKRYIPLNREYVDERFETFNKGVVYNSRQCSGEMTFIPKDTQSNQENYISNQVINNNDNTFIIDRNERDWTMNDLRDIRINYTDPIWDSNTSSLQNEYFIDKTLNTSTLDINKDWTQLESFRDKYLVIRLIFDKFADIKLLTNYSVESESKSFR